MGFAADIVKQVKKDTGLHLIYPPGFPVRLGDIMERNDAGVWMPVGNLYDEVPEFRLETVPDDAPDDFSASSERGFDFDVKLSGQTSDLFKHVAEAKAGVRVRLNGSSSFVLSLSGTRFTRIKDPAALWKAYKADHSILTWDLSRRLVTSVAKADSATFLASAEGGATYELEATGDVDVAKIKVGDLAANFQLKSTLSGMATFAGKEATLLYGAHKMRLFGGVGAAGEAGLTVDQIELDSSPTAED